MVFKNHFSKNVNGTPHPLTPPPPSWQLPFYISIFQPFPKGRMPSPRRMNFRKSSKQPLTPPLSFSENQVAIFFCEVIENGNFRSARTSYSTFEFRSSNQGSFQKLLSGFCPLRGYPPYPLKGLKMHDKRQKIEFLDLKTCFLAEFSIAELGGTPPPLTENHRKFSLTNG